MTIRDSLYFIFDGKTSEEMNLWNINLDSGLLEETLLGNRTILETSIRGNPSPYFKEVQYEPLTIPVNFCFKDNFDNNKLAETLYWLTPSYYKPLQFSENMNKIFYCLPIDNPTLMHTGLKQGFIKLNFRCKYPWALSPIYEQIYDCTSADETNINFINNGYMNVFPQLDIEVDSSNTSGNVSIFNLSNANKEFAFTGLLPEEIVFIDNKTGTITTDQSNLYRYDNFNNVFLELLRGISNLKVVGKCKIKFKYQFVVF